jgi:hypothetical protein
MLDDEKALTVIPTHGSMRIISEDNLTKGRQRFSTVEDKTGKVYDQYKNKGIETTFEMNPGNHFKDADLRLAKGIAWILK